MRPSFLFPLLVCCLVSLTARTQSITTSGKSYSTLGAITPARDAFFFTLNDDEHGLELWISDGTTKGTTLAKDINPEQSSSSPDNLTLLDNILYFTADDGVHGNELWLSDGTPEGTHIVADVTPGLRSSVIKELRTFNEMLFISIETEEEGTVWLQSDGTSGGTVIADESILKMIKDNNNERQTDDSPLLLRDKNYFTASARGKGEELWRSAGNKSMLVKDIRAGREASDITGLVVVDEKAYFSAHDGIHGSELWTSDGTAEGTEMIMDILPGQTSSLPRNLTAFHGQLYFSIFAETGIQLWVTDGSANGTHQVFPASEVEPISFPVFLTSDFSTNSDALRVFANQRSDVSNDDGPTILLQSVRIRERKNVEMVRVTKLD